MASLPAQVPAAQELRPNLVDNIESPLRYRPDGADFVIENGTEFFNRPLYGGNTAFRVDGGDKPEFVLYLPGRGGNLRLGIRQVERADPGAFSSNQRVGVNTLHPAKWLHEAASITTRYRPGELLYEIRDPLLGTSGVLRLAVVAWHQAEGLGLRVEGEGLAPGLEFVWAYGGVNGQRGRRDGDIGTENVPISEWFRLQPEFCNNNTIELADNAFTLRAPLPREQAATIAGLAPAGAQLGVADAANWNDLPALLNYVGPSSLDKLGTLSSSNGLADGPARRQAPALQILVGRVPLGNSAPLYFSLQRLAAPATPADLDTYREVTAPRAERTGPRALASEQRAGVSLFHLKDLPQHFAATEAHFAALRGRVTVVTPDPYLNAAVGALNVAADAVWDEPQQAIMHGAIAWRTKLLGWRGPYALDALGWHDRARKHFEYWATRQNTDPIPDKFPPPEPETNLARSRTALHSNGNLSASHYDMNLVYIDALFRHLLWTGDVDFAKKMWPMIERHLAWERRLFRREFTTPAGEKLPLYEAYAAIWASDDLQYSGGGTAHASAYNYWHNKMAARIAPFAGADPAPFAQEADLIAAGMRKLLWLNDTGMFAESKDLLGRQLVHPSAALWSFYHVMDADIVTGKEAGDMAVYVAADLPWLPAPKVADGVSGYIPATTNWMPYTWSLNNVVFAESMHGALGLWQADSLPAAWAAMRGAVVTSMFAGICPGNVGSMTYHDAYRRESQRDFADGSGTFSRALVEGLFGVRPDALKGELLVMPGFPQTWSEASIEHPSFSMSFRSTTGSVNRYTIRPRFARGMSLRFLAPAADVRLRSMRAKVNGREVKGWFIGDGTWPRFEITAPAAEAWDIEIEEEKEPFTRPPMIYPLRREPRMEGLIEQEKPAGKPETVELTAYFNDRVSEIFKPGKYLSPRSPFVSLALPSQGIGAWAGHVNATAEIDDTGLRAAAAANGGRITLPNGVAFVTPGPGQAKNILFTSQWDNYPREAAVPLIGHARRLHLLMAGSTNAMQSRLDNGEVVVTYADGTASRLALRNPETWWPIEQDYFIDDYQFRIDAPLPTRVNLKTGEVRVLDRKAFKGQGRLVPGGAATVLALDLDPAKELKSLTVRALANDIVIGLMAATLER